MDALILRLTHRSEDIRAEVVILRHSGAETSLGDLYGLRLTDVEWLISANTSENSTPFIVEVKDA